MSTWVHNAADGQARQLDTDGCGTKKRTELESDGNNYHSQPEMTLFVSGRLRYVISSMSKSICLLTTLECVGREGLIFVRRWMRTCFSRML